MTATKNTKETVMTKNTKEILRTAVEAHLQESIRKIDVGTVAADVVREHVRRALYEVLGDHKGGWDGSITFADIEKVLKEHARNFAPLMLDKFLAEARSDILREVLSPKYRKELRTVFMRTLRYEIEQGLGRAARKLADELKAEIVADARKEILGELHDGKDPK